MILVLRFFFENNAKEIVSKMEDTYPFHLEKESTIPIWVQSP
jgi:hypothetical protein